MCETGACYMLENGMEKLKVASDNFGGRGQGWFTLQCFKSDELNGKLRLKLWGVPKSMLENVWVLVKFCVVSHFQTYGAEQRTPKPGAT